MTKAEAVSNFNTYERPNLIDTSITTLRCAWNEYVDMLYRDGQITERQADTWVNPFDKPKRKVSEKRQCIGLMLAQRLTASLTGYGIPYNDLAYHIYGELNNIGKELSKGDWLQFPNGTSFTMDYKVGD